MSDREFRLAAAQFRLAAALGWMIRAHATGEPPGDAMIGEAIRLALEAGTLPPLPDSWLERVAMARREIEATRPATSPG